MRRIQVVGLNQFHPQAGYNYAITLTHLDRYTTLSNFH